MADILAPACARRCAVHPSAAVAVIQRIALDTPLSQPCTPVH
ncbi:hypothetical protein WAE61_18730 [Comamonadaceae bacterium PP-2]